MARDLGEALAIETLRDGGFVVTIDGRRVGMQNVPVFACGDLDKLLNYIRMHYEPSARERQAAERNADPA